MILLYGLLIITNLKPKMGSSQSTHVYTELPNVKGPITTHPLRQLMDQFDDQLLNAPIPPKQTYYVTPINTDCGLKPIHKYILLLGSKYRNKCWELIKNDKENVNAVTDKGWTPLMLVCLYAGIFNCEPLIDNLIVNGADVNMKVLNNYEPGGYTPLMIVASNITTWSSIGALKRLIKYGAHIDPRDNMGRTALSQAVIRCGNGSSPEAVETLIEARSNIKQRDNMHDSILIQAIKEYKTSTLLGIETFLKCGIDVEYGSDPITPLHFTITYSKLTPNEKCEIIDILIKYGAKIKSQTLILVIREIQGEYCFRIIEMMINTGADPNGFYDGTPLYWAIETYIDKKEIPLMDIVQFLVKKGADCNFSSISPFRWALRHYRDPLIKQVFDFFLANGGDIHRPAGNGNSIIIEACYATSDSSMVDKLVADGADINHQNKDGDTPLNWIMIREPSLSLVKRLIKAGSNLEIVNNKGNRPSDIAFDKKQYGIYHLLIEHGAYYDISVIDNILIPSHIKKLMVDKGRYSPDEIFKFTKTGFRYLMGTGYPFPKDFKVCPCGNAIHNGTNYCAKCWSEKK